MNRHVLLYGLLALVLAAIRVPQACAAEAELAPDADADIRAGFPDLPFDRQVVVVGGNSSSSWHKAYFRFQLPPNFQTATAATFTVYTTISRTFSANFAVHGLNDGVPGETDWIESHFGGMTWNTAPGNDTASGDFVDATLLGNFTVLANSMPGLAYSVSSPMLVDFLNADSNGYVTLMMNFGSTITSSNMQFAAHEWNGPGADTGYPGPQLTLEYEAKPLDPGDFNEDGVVDGTDFLWWQRGFSPAPLSSDDLENWKAGFGSDVSVAAHAVPEPGTATLLLAGLGIAGLRSRMRRLRF